MPGRPILHTRAHPASTETAESCRTANSAADTILLPCAQTPSPHMAAPPPHTPTTRKTHNSNKNQPQPHKHPTLPCATPQTTTPTRHTTPPRCHPSRTDTPHPTPRSIHSRLETGHAAVDLLLANGSEMRHVPFAPELAVRASTSGRPDRTRPTSTRTTTELDAEPDRSRHEFRPISARNRTDLEAEHNQARDGGPAAERGGFEPPVRQAHSGFQDRHIRPLCHLSKRARGYHLAEGADAHPHRNDECRSNPLPVRPQRPDHASSTQPESQGAESS